MKITQIIEHKKGVRAVKSTVKPRNFVAKNAIQSGAGAHKDKKKAQKQGDVKHKAQVAEGAEFGAYYNEQLAQKVFDENPNISTSGRAEELLSAGFKIAVLDLGKKQAQGLFGYDEDFPSDFVSSYGHLQKQTEGIGDTISTVATKVGDALAGALPKEYRPFDNDTAAKNQQSMKIVKNESNAEYDDEAGMADNNLETLRRAVDGIDDVISAGDNLPEWCQEKIAVAKSMLIAVWDYMRSEEERGVNEQVGTFSSKDMQMSADGARHNATMDLLRKKYGDNFQDKPSNLMHYNQAVNTIADTKKPGNYQSTVTLTPKDYQLSPNLTARASMDPNQDFDYFHKGEQLKSDHPLFNKVKQMHLDSMKPVADEPDVQEGRMTEASTNPDTMSATDYDRYQQGQMDSEKRNFKRGEMEQELGHEDRGMYFVVIAKNGKWEHTKAQPRQEGMNAAQKVINALHAKYPSMHLGMQGPDGKVYNMGKGK